MDSDSPQDDDKTKTEARKDRMMLSLKDVEELLRQDAEVCGKMVEKTPEEWRQWFDQLFDQVEREGLGVPIDPVVLEENERLSWKEEDEGDEPT